MGAWYGKPRIDARDGLQNDLLNVRFRLKVESGLGESKAVDSNSLARISDFRVFVTCVLDQHVLTGKAIEPTVTVAFTIVLEELGRKTICRPVGCRLRRDSGYSARGRSSVRGRRLRLRRNSFCGSGFRSGAGGSRRSTTGAAALFADLLAAILSASALTSPSKRALQTGECVLDSNLHA